MPYPTIRVRALIVSNNYLLLARLRTRPVSFLPGGRVEPSESLVAALQREVYEECEAVAEGIEYLGAVENLWVEDGRRIHDLNHFFRVECASLNSAHTPYCNDEGVAMRWVPVEQVADEPIKPESLKQLLCSWFGGNRDVWWAYEQES